MELSPRSPVPPASLPTAKDTGCEAECALVGAQCPEKTQVFRYVLSSQDLLKPVLDYFHHDDKTASEGSSGRP